METGSHVFGIPNATTTRNSEQGKKHMEMNPIHEKKLRDNWTFLRNELAVEDLSDKLVEEGSFSDDIRSEIVNVKPNTRMNESRKVSSIFDTNWR
ncbi:hypothetical protein KUTeg_013719 [Tegillarca granosa]|uniref:Uncharacterized protein n=1 Tax=Tegillarca granosa TaxID=220873 RepID=A0ABQ9EYC8_TEGGR|nr:hypothetical protein KUTeg_013719 [Tegillarca granosa]